MIIKIINIIWIDRDKKNFGESWFEKFIIVCPWFSMRNIKIQKIVVDIMEKKIIIDEIMCHLINPINIINSAAKLIEGGALMFVITNINHQNVKLGFEEKFLFKDVILRVWNLV